MQITFDNLFHSLWNPLSLNTDRIAYAHFFIGNLTLQKQIPKTILCEIIEKNITHRPSSISVSLLAIFLMNKPEYSFFLCLSPWFRLNTRKMPSQSSTTHL